MTRSHDQEKAAAQAVQRVLGGTSELNDTGAEPRQFDVLHELDDGLRVAVEVTSSGVYDNRKAKSAIRKRARNGDLAGESLAYLWHVTVSKEKQISTLRLSELDQTLRDFEAQGLESVSSRGAHPHYGDLASRALAQLGVESAVLWNRSPPSGEPKILLGTSWSVIGGPESLPDALGRVLACTDNQDKLAAADADERHLYVRMEDQAAASGLRGLWPLPHCPPDPRGVIDVIWVFAPWASSALLHRVVPGTDRWQHFVMSTGDPVPESALRES
jgi:hypothetical protein